MSFLNTVYNSVFKRTSTFAFAVVMATFFFERAFDQGGDYIFDRINKGKLFKDINYKQA